VPRVGEVLKGGRMKNKTEKENPQHKRSKLIEAPSWTPSPRTSSAKPTRRSTNEEAGSLGSTQPSSGSAYDP